MASWDRQPKESAKAYAHFAVYRDLGPGRTLEKTGKLRGISAATCEEFSVKYQWVSRCDQWDAHLERAAARSYVTELERQSRQRAAAHSALLGKAAELLKGVKDARLSEVASAFKVATDGMRTEAGLATERVEVDVTDARAVIDALPAEISRAIRGLLAEDPEPGSAREAAGELQHAAGGGAGVVH